MNHFPSLTVGFFLPHIDLGLNIFFRCAHESYLNINLKQSITCTPDSKHASV